MTELSRCLDLLAEMSEEIRCCLTEVENCFRLLVPLDFGPCPEGEVLNQAFGRTEEGASGSSSLGHTASRQSCASGPQDEEQPCCSRDLPAFMCYSGAAGDGEKPAQTDTRSPSEDEDEGSDPEEFVRSHGLGSHKYTLDVELSSGNWLARCHLINASLPSSGLVGLLLSPWHLTQGTLAQVSLGPAVASR